MEGTRKTAHIRELFVKNRPFFSALGSEERQELMLIMLEEHNLSVGELAKRTTLSRPTVSHHLKILKETGIVAPQKHGNKMIYCLQSGEYLASISKLIDEAERLTT